MRRGIIAAVVGVLVIGAAAYFVANMVVSSRLRSVVDQQIAKLPLGTTVTYRSLSHEVLTGTTDLDGLEMEMHGSQPAIKATVRHIRAKHAALGFGDAYDKAVAAPDSVTFDTLLPVVGQVDVNGIAVDVETGSNVIHYGIDELRVADVGYRPWAMLQKDLSSLGDALTTLVPQPGPPSDPAEVLRHAGKILRLELAWALSADLGETSISGLSVKSSLNPIPGQPPQDVLVAVASQHVDGLHGGAYGRSTGDDFEEKIGPLIDVRFAHMEYTDINFREPARRLVAGEPFSLALMDGFHTGVIFLSGMSVQAPGTEPITLARVDFDPVTIAKDAPVTLHFGFDGLSLSPSVLDRDPRVAGGRKALGLSGLTLKFGLGATWDPVKGVAAFDRTFFDIAELGRLDLAGEVSGLPLGTDPALVADSIRYDSASLRFTDASLTGRLVAAGAAQSRTTEPQFRSQIQTVVQLQLGAFLGQPAAEDAAASLGKFMEAPRTLTLWLGSDVPLSKADLTPVPGTSPSELIAKLKPRLTAND